jgi:hypothetical protein
MIRLVWFVVAVLASLFKSKIRLEAENAALRHQLFVLRRTLRGRVRLTNHDRWFFVQLYRWFPSILTVLTIIRPATLVRWHRAGFRCCWRWKSRRRGARPQIEAALRTLIRRMSIENPLWGSPRIHGELLKLGFAVAQSSVAKYMVKRRGPPSQEWEGWLISIHVETSKHLAPCAPHKSSDVNQCCLLRLNLALYEVTRPSLRCRSGFVRAPQNVPESGACGCKGSRAAILAASKSSRLNLRKETSASPARLVAMGQQQKLSSTSAFKSAACQSPLLPRECCSMPRTNRRRDDRVRRSFRDCQSASRLSRESRSDCRRPARQSPASPLPSVIVSTKELLRSKFSTLRIRQDFDSLTSE